MTVEIIERHRGLSKSSNYYYVIEGNSLNHISYYATNIQKISDSVTYIVDPIRLAGKQIMEITSTNSGIICFADVFPSEHLGLPYNQRKSFQISLDTLNNFEFNYLSDNEKKFLKSEWRVYYQNMLNEVRKYISYLYNRYNIYVNVYHSLISCQIYYNVNYPLSFLIPYDEYSRRKSLENLTKQIHQIWIALRIFIELISHNLIKQATYSHELFLVFEQGSYHPLFTFRCGRNECSLWYEFDVNPHTMCKGLLRSKSCPGLKELYNRIGVYQMRHRSKNLPLRPDFVILRNNKDCNEICDRGIEVAMIIECKDQEYIYWINKIRSQIIPYDRIFQPHMLVLASMRKIPDHIKVELERYGLIVIDEVYPGGTGEHRLIRIIKQYFIA